MSFIMNDSCYAKGVLPSVDTIKNKDKFDINWLSNNQIRKILPQHTMKDIPSSAIWDWGTPFASAGEGKGHVAKPGMAPAAEGSAFLAELVYESKFFAECDFQTTDNPNNKFTFLKLENRLQGLRAIESGKQIRHLHERNPGQLESRIEEVFAEPYVSYIEIPWTIMIENLERGNFLQTVQELDANSRQNNMGEIGLYAKKDSAASSADGLNINDGLLQQLKDRNEMYADTIEDTRRINPQGYYCGIHGNGTDPVKIDFGKTIADDGTDAIRQMMQMSAQYDIQQVKGDPNKKFLVSPEVYSQLQILQTERPTGLGDRLIQTEKGMMINDCMIEKCMDLAVPTNGYKQHILLGNFKAGFCNCMREDFQTHWEFHQYEEHYVGDTKVYWVGFLKDPRKILAAEVDNLPSQVAAAGSGSSGSGSGSGSGSSGSGSGSGSGSP